MLTGGGRPFETAWGVLGKMLKFFLNSKNWIGEKWKPMENPPKMAWLHLGDFGRKQQYFRGQRSYHFLPRSHFSGGIRGGDSNSQNDKFAVRRRSRNSGHYPTSHCHRLNVMNAGVWYFANGVFNFNMHFFNSLVMLTGWFRSCPRTRRMYTSLFALAWFVWQGRFELMEGKRLGWKVQ